MREVIDRHGKQAKIIKMRNPDHGFEWNGEWSDNSSCWTDELRRELDVKIANDGIFWISINDFIQNYVSLHICKYVDEYNFFSFEKEEYDNRNGYHMFSAILSEAGDHIFSVS